LRCRHPAATELELLVDWRVRFAVEALGATDGPDLRQASADDVRLQHERGTDWLLLAGAAPVSYSVFNAMLADIVQIGGVWTPPERRGREIGRASCREREDKAEGDAAQNVYRSVEHDQKTGLTTFGQFHQHHRQMASD